MAVVFNKQPTKFEEKVNLDQFLL